MLAFQPAYHKARFPGSLGPPGCRFHAVLLRLHGRAPESSIGEQRRLLRWHFDSAVAAKCRGTLLSGDVHVAASGVLHPPPSGAEAFFIDHIRASDPPSMEAGIEAEMQTLPGSHSRLYAKRNWLSLSRYKAVPHIWARWWMEGENLEPLTKVIHACEPGAAGDEPLNK